MKRKEGIRRRRVRKEGENRRLRKQIEARRVETMAKLRREDDDDEVQWFGKFSIIRGRQKLEL